MRPVWRLRTGLGRKITATANHPFLTFNGWQPLGELKADDRIATVRRLPAGNISYCFHEAFVTGAMIGDGSCGHPDSLTFTNFDPDVVETFRRNVEQLGNVQMTQHKAKGHYGFRRLSLIGHQRSGLNLLLEKSNLLVRNFKGEGIPTVYDLAQNYPNPFNPSTTIRYQIPQDGIVTLKIYDILGAEVATLINEQKVAGKYEVNFNASTLASGVYIYKIQSGDFVSSKKMILIK